MPSVKEGYLENSTSFFSTILAGYQSIGLTRTLRAQPKGFSSPYQSILSGSTQTARVPSLHTLSKPPLLKGHDLFHYEMDPLGEAPGSWSGATAPGYPVSYSPRCLPVSSGLGLKGWLQILHRVSAACFCSYGCSNTRLRVVSFAICKSSLQTRRCGEETQKRLHLPSALPKMLQRKNTEQQQGL